MTASPSAAMPPLASADASGRTLEQLMLAMRFPHVSDAFLSNDPHLRGAAASSARGFAKLRQRPGAQRGAARGMSSPTAGSVASPVGV